MSISFDDAGAIEKIVLLKPVPKTGTQPTKRLDEITFDGEAMNGPVEVHQKWDMGLGKPHGGVGDNGVREPTTSLLPPHMRADRDDLARYKDMVNHPPHYTSHPSGIECIDVVRHMPYNIGVAMAYLWRHEQKGGTEDLRKAIWHIEDQIKWREKKASTTTQSDADGYHGC